MKKMMLPAMLMLAMGLQAQTPEAVVQDLQRSWQGIKNNILAAAEAMPEDGYSFKPTPEVRSFGGWVGHAADAQIRASTLELVAECQRTISPCKNGILQVIPNRIQCAYNAPRAVGVAPPNKIDALSTGGTSAGRVATNVMTRAPPCAANLGRAIGSAPDVLAPSQRSSWVRAAA